MIRGGRWRGGLLALAMGLAAARPQARAGSPSGPAPIEPARDIGFDQRLGDQVPLDLEFRDEEGRTIRLGDYFGRRPVILSLAYYDCPMLCGMALEGIASSLKTLTFDAGRDFEVITVSFDPRETPRLARMKKGGAIDRYGRSGAADGWHFLTGDEGPIRRLTAAVGFRYAWDETIHQYAHPTGIVILTPGGRVARYLFGVDYAPKDLRLALLEAAGGGIGTLADRLLLLCYRYDPRVGRYSVLALGLVRTFGALTLLGLGGFIAVMVRRDRARQRAE